MPAPHRRSSSRAEVRQSCPGISPFSNSCPRLAGLCIGFAFARARLASLGYQSYVLNILFAATLSSARISDALHLLPLCSPPTALSHGLSLIPLAAPGCFWLLLTAFGCSWLCFLAFGRLPGIAPGAILKTRFREAVFEPLENGSIWGAFGYFLVHWRRPGRRGRFLGFQNNSLGPGLGSPIR